MPGKPAPAADPSLHSLADFRYLLRKFLHFSEEAAAHAGLAPQQHQLMLQIAGAPAGVATSIGYLAERLFLRHHSVVELSARCEALGLIARGHSPADRRVVMLRLTAAGNRLLRALSQAHARELNELAPQLIRSLKALSSPSGKRN